MFKEKVNGRTHARRTTDHDISSLASGAKNENFEAKEQSYNQQHLIQQCFPSNQGHRSIFSFVQSFEDKKKD